jgi:TPR repeat protein
MKKNVAAKLLRLFLALGFLAWAPSVLLAKSEPGLSELNKGKKAFRENNYSVALKWYRKAAAKGNSSAECFIGYFYQNGMVVSKDALQAMKWYRQAADQGDSNGQWFVAQMYIEGSDVPKDIEKAIPWLKKSADQGNATSEEMLGELYEKGLGVTEDKDQAYEWYKKSSNQGNKEAQKHYEDLALERATK